ncbi:hypothetical protein GMST_03040 [Geomonas silvestris]|uniref:YbbR-like domain-containing protein n=1 Tax=Geomonas silvestris TaxID=2740184 RepID=A0A6V8ME45_9BACT|nr:hypothetical protein [Geomonas silvestris]GFO57979.1 hypothetical protein GMST_03040 [Geomonas silvestris]
MSETRPLEEMYGVKFLAVLLALLIWLTVAVERPGEVTIPVPVNLEHLPRGLSMVSPPPGVVQVTVSGPRVLLVRPFLLGARCTLDLSTAGPGSVSLSTGDFRFDVDGELKIVRTIPQTLHLDFALVGSK